MVIVWTPNSEGDASRKSFHKLLSGCLRRSASPEEFLSALSEQGQSTAASEEQAKMIIPLACALLEGSVELALQYLDLLLSTDCISSGVYVEALLSFSQFNRGEGDVQQIVERITHFIFTSKFSYTDESACLEMCGVVMAAVRWMLGGMESAAVEGGQSKKSTLLMKAINRLVDDPFTKMLLFIGQWRCAEGDKLDVSTVIDRCKKGEEGEGEGEQKPISIGKELRELEAKLLTALNEPPIMKWEPFREDFMGKESHPSILTLTAIYATLRVMTPPPEIASALLTIGQILGLTPRKIAFDFLRACFLIQLETSTTPSSSSSTAKTQQDLGEREALSDMFVYIKAPQVLKAMGESSNNSLSKEDLLEALERINGCSTLLNEVDSRKYDNSLASILDWLKVGGVLEADERYERMLNKRAPLRKASLSLRPDLLSLLNTGGEPQQNQPHSRIAFIRLTQKACAVLEKTMGQEDEAASRKLVPTMLDRIFQSGKINVDTVCSVFCAEGTLPEFSSKIAAINYRYQQGPSKETEKSRSVMFDLTFLLLARIQQVYEDLRLEELVGGEPQTGGAFYQWTFSYIQHLETEEPMDHTQRGNDYREDWVEQMKRGNAFWIGSSQSIDYGALVECIPMVGASLLEEYQKDAHHEPHREKEVQNVISTFRHMTCLLLCFVQWLETQKQTPASQALAKTILSYVMVTSPFPNTSTVPEDNHRWLYALSVVKRSLRQLAETSCPREQPYTWIINFAQRQLPTLHQNQVPDMKMLKEAFLYANQQTWASPDVLAHINRCNKALEQGKWIKCFLMQTLKMWTFDEMDAASELCLTTALTYPVPCLFEIIRQVVEQVFFGGDASGQSKSNSQVAADVSNTSSMGASPYHHHPNSTYSTVTIHKTSATVLAKMLVRALILLLWAEEQRKANEKAKAAKRGSPLLVGSRKRKREELTVGESTAQMDQSTASTASSSRKYVDIVLTTVQNVFERFDKMVRGSTLRPPVSFIIFFMHELAKAPRSPYWERLVQLMPINLVFSLARLDAASIPLPMFLSMYDLHKEEYRIPALKYACMQRNWALNQQ